VALAQQLVKTFYNLLVNTGIASVTNFTVWFAITFYVYLETKSVFATGTISGIYLTLTMVSGFWFGSLVDHHDKKVIMMLSSAVSLVLYAASFALYVLAPPDAFNDVTSVRLWVFIVLLIAGVIAGNIRNIALPTLVTVLVAEERRAKANGLVGMVGGISFGVVSVISGVLVGHSGMYWVLILGMVMSAVAIVHLLFVKTPARTANLDGTNEPKRVDIRGTMIVLGAIPGLFALILFTTFNNLIGGMFMALVDAYGLSLVSVETWGLLLGILSFAFMIGGAAIARWGLGRNPLRAMMLANVVIWTTCTLFTIQSWIALFMVGMFVFMAVSPYIEASEQTVIQKVVPEDRQGRVFGFAQSVEQTASPLTAFLIGPITQFFFIPLMDTGKGADLIGDWFGTGPDRGIALVFTLAGLVGLIATLFAMRSRHYRNLSAKYLAA
jgi:DHA3 family multidrug efflux protein-like MFS transporter